MNLLKRIYFKPISTFPINFITFNQRYIYKMEATGGTGETQVKPEQTFPKTIREYYEDSYRV